MTRTSLNVLLFLSAFGLVVGAYFALNPAQHAKAVGPMATVISVATSTAATSVTTSARIMATTTNPLDAINSYNRTYAVVCNPNANPVWLNLDGDKAANLSTGNVTTVIAAAAGYNACYELTDRNQYSGSVTASSTNGTATTITVKQYVQ